MKEEEYEVVNEMPTNGDSSTGYAERDLIGSSLDHHKTEAHTCDDTEHPWMLDTSRRGARQWFSGCHPEVVELVFWECGRRSGCVFGGGLSLLIAFHSLSLLSLVAYSALLLLALSALLSAYRYTLSLAHKQDTTSHNSVLSDVDVCVRPERLASLVEPVCVPVSGLLSSTRDLLLIRDVAQSAKFGGLMYLLTYVGAIFNALTLLAIGWVGVFTVPVLYERNQKLVDSLARELVKKCGQLLTDMYSAVEPKLSAAFEKLPPPVQNAFYQIQGKATTTTAIDKND